MSRRISYRGPLLQLTAPLLHDRTGLREPVVRQEGSTAIVVRQEGRLKRACLMPAYRSQHALMRDRVLDALALD